MFSTKSHDKRYFDAYKEDFRISLDYQEARLNHDTVNLCEHYQAVCVFVNDVVDSSVVKRLSELGILHIALRCAGFNNVDLRACRELGISVSRVPAYSPEAVAEHTLALMMTLNRKTHKAYNRVRENNFSLEGLVGFNFYQKTVGVIGTGNIGKAVINILLGLGCEVLCYDPFPDDGLKNRQGVAYTELDNIFRASDVITLHCPLNDATHHIINPASIAVMKSGVMLINTSRGGLIDTKAVIAGLKNKKLGYLGLDVYEMESDLFFEDKSWEIIQDDVFDRLSGFPNVLITGHQGFFTHEALAQIATITLTNLSLFDGGKTDPVRFIQL